MTATQTWGRKESWIWPPRGFYYTYGAILLACLLGASFVFLRFEFGMSPLQRYYLPYSIRTWSSGWRAPSGQYQLLYAVGPHKPTRVALDPDVQVGTTPQPNGHSLPVKLSATAQGAGYKTLFREAPRRYQNQALRLFLRRWIYGETDIVNYFRAPMLFGLLAVAIQLPFSLRKDIARRKQLRYGRRLKGPILVEPEEFTKQLAGDGIGLQVDHRKTLLRIPRHTENTHFLIVGDTGSGKSTIIRQILCQVAERGHSAIVYDPACEFVRQFYLPDRGDIVLNPLDERCHTGVHRRSCKGRLRPRRWPSRSFSLAATHRSFSSRVRRRSSLICSHTFQRQRISFIGCRIPRRSTSALGTPS
jgi:Type IV secretion-system coupling protein DNA-binding domain